MKIRPFTPLDTQRLIDLFRQTVHTVGRSKYTQEQLNAWAPESIDVKRWTIRFESTFTLVAERGDQILGFINLESKGCVDMLYVNASIQNQGVASALYAALESEAKNRGLKMVYSDVSLTARHFFLSKGFVVQKEYIKEVSGVRFLNAMMVKDL